MKIHLTFFVVAMVVATFHSASISSQDSEQSVIVVFHDDAHFRSFPPGLLDARAKANPAAWQYLDRAVLGAVRILERQHGFRADHVYRNHPGFCRAVDRRADRGTEKRYAHRRHRIDRPMQQFAQALPWGINRIDADLSSTQSGDGAGAVTNVNVYVLDNGVDRMHPDLNVVNHVNFTCAHGSRVAGVVAARDNDLGVVGVIPGAPITAVKVTTCDPLIGSTSVVVKGIDWVTANAVRPAVANMSIGGFRARRSMLP